jgi:hypothetical protein
VTAVSLACLATAVIAFFPPWEIGVTPSSTALHTVLLLTFMVLVGIGRSARERWAQWFFPGLILVAVVARTFSNAVSFGIVMGLFVALVGAVHIMAVSSAVVPSDKIPR